MEQTNEVQNPMEEALPNTEKVEETKNQEVEETTTQEVEETTAQDVEETKSQEVEETKAQEAEEAVAEAENAVAQNEAETQPAAEAEPETDYSALNREELVAAMRELLQQEIQNIKNLSDKFQGIIFSLIQMVI